MEPSIKILVAMFIYAINSKISHIYSMPIITLNVAGMYTTNGIGVSTDCKWNTSQTMLELKSKRIHV